MSENEKWRLKDIYSNIEDAEISIEPTIDNEGRIVYGVVLLAPMDLRNVKAICTFSSGAQVFTEDYECSSTHPNNYGADFSYKSHNGVPVAACRTLNEGPDGENKPELKKFSASGSLLRDQKLFILDLRGNRGGYSMYVGDWFESFMGKEPRAKEFSAQRISRLPHPTKSGTPGKWDIWDNESGKWQDNESLIIVLTDGAIGSSGEGFVYDLRTLDNVIFVGCNTMGCALSGNAVECYLPNSGLCVEIAMGFKFCETIENIDGRGIDPDIWVDPQYAMEAVLKMIEYYNIEPSETLPEGF
jgi:hypothetical protein